MLAASERSTARQLVAALVRPGGGPLGAVGQRRERLRLGHQLAVGGEDVRILRGVVHRRVASTAGCGWSCTRAPSAARPRRGRGRGRRRSAGRTGSRCCATARAGRRRGRGCRGLVRRARGSVEVEAVGGGQALTERVPVLAEGELGPARVELDQQPVAGHRVQREADDAGRRRAPRWRSSWCPQPQARRRRPRPRSSWSSGVPVEPTTHACSALRRWKSSSAGRRLGVEPRLERPVVGQQVGDRGVDASEDADDLEAGAVRLAVAAELRGTSSGSRSGLAQQLHLGERRARRAGRARHVDRRAWRRPRARRRASATAAASAMRSVSVHVSSRSRPGRAVVRSVAVSSTSILWLS